MSRVKRLTVVLLLNLSLIASYAQTPPPAKDPIRVTDMLKIKTAGDIHLSKDGRLVECLLAIPA